MKYISLKPALLIAMVAVVFTGCSVTSRTEKANGVSFSQYKTFGWKDAVAKKSDRMNSDIVDNNIKNAVSQELEKKGWKETDANPDVLLDYSVAVKRDIKRESDPVYLNPYTPFLYGRRGMYRLWYPSALMGYHTYNVPFTEGELNINMVDAKTDQLIWQGWAKGEINNRQITSKEAAARVKSIFRKFDYPAHTS